MELLFAKNGALRKINIKDRVITLISSETNWMPVNINISKLDENLESVIATNKVNRDELVEIVQLKTEEEMAQDITEDFKKTGWRLVKKNGSNNQ